MKGSVLVDYLIGSWIQIQALQLQAGGAGAAVKLLHQSWSSGEAATASDQQHKNSIGGR